MVSVKQRPEISLFIVQHDLNNLHKYGITYFVIKHYSTTSYFMSTDIPFEM